MKEVIPKYHYWFGIYLWGYWPSLIIGKLLVQLPICKYFWWLLRRVKNLRSTACKHRRKHYLKCDVIYRYLHIELIWCLLMVQYLQNNVIMKWTTRFIRFTGCIPLKCGSTTTPPIIAHCKKNSDVKRRITHCDPQNIQYKTHPEFWPSHRRIFKTSLYYKTRLILETRR